MLLRLIINNFLSFYDPIEFNMFPNPKREFFQDHINTTASIPLLKQSIIYGANGSGKSNFVKALWFLQSFLTKTDFLAHIDIDEYVFQLAEVNKKAISFEIEIHYKDKYYLYTTSIAPDNNGKCNIKEELSISGIGKEEDKTIFKRDNCKVESDDIPEATRKILVNFLKKNHFASIVPLNQQFPIISSNDLQNFHDWFRKELSIITINSNVPGLIDMMSINPQLFEYTRELLNELDITSSLAIKETPLDEWLSNKKNAQGIQDVLKKSQMPSNSQIAFLSDNRRNEFNITIKNGEKIVREFLFEQMGINGFHKQMKISSQSDGTVRLLTLLPAIYNATRGKVVFIDEIENSMHPNLILRLIKYYISKASKGQLIFSTHLTRFLDQDNLVRPDELWLVEKENGSSRMRSFNDFKIHRTINIENGYINGRYGGVPKFSQVDTEISE